jgi:Spy/CpxP family protein refolding chaperone
MRTLLAVVALALGVSAYATLPAATQEKAGQKVTGGLVDRIQDVNLTEEQETKLAELRKAFRPKVEQAAKDLATVVKEEVTKVRAVLTEEQKTKLAALKEERQEIRAERLAERIAHLHELDLTEGEMSKFADIGKEYAPKIIKAMDGLRGMLTDAQRQVREEGLKAGKTRKEVIESLKLTDEQKQKVEAVGKQIGTMVHEELEKMREVLTEGQKAKVDELKEERKEHVRDRMACRIANLKDLDLTEAQKRQIAGIRQEYRPKVQEAGNHLRAAVREHVEHVLAVIKR